ncbi:IDEAL domain-containing protein [bacterium LRH843]|nr:IDEAL domain-containing protein [bacterium LRH843]
MNDQFAMDQNVLEQLKIIKILEKRSETTVQSLYAQAILEYSLYHHEKDKLLVLIDQALVSRNKHEFYEYSNRYNQLEDDHRNGKIIIENGFELYLTFD